MSADGTLLYADRASQAVTPASAQKLIVADAALAALGPAYRFDTILATQTPPQNGVLSGDLWLGGSGDPSLRSDDLRAGAAALQRAGITRIDGGVAVDSRAIAGEEINPLWDASDANEDFMSAVSGISVDEDTVEFHVRGSASGAPADVWIKPKSAAVRYYGGVSTGGGDDVIVAATQTPNLFRLDGVVPPGIAETFYLPVHGITHYAGAVMTALLRSQHIDVAQPPTAGTVPLDASIVWTHRSKPLDRLVKFMLVHSDNHFAEQFMRAVGARRGGRGDDASGLVAERQLLHERGIPAPNLHIVDGSGLAHANRVAAITLATILARAGHGGSPDLYPLLPRGGKDGTLRMYRFHEASGRVRAKSGHLSDVSALAGYVQTRRHGRAIFAFLIDGSPGDPDSAIVDAVDRISAR